MLKLATLVAASAALALDAAADGQTLKTVQDRGKLFCGVSEGIAGFSIKDDKGESSGFDVDYCRALQKSLQLRNQASRSQSTNFRSGS